MIDRIVTRAKDLRARARRAWAAAHSSGEVEIPAKVVGRKAVTLSRPLENGTEAFVWAHAPRLDHILESEVVGGGPLGGNYSIVIAPGEALVIRAPDNTRVHVDRLRVSIHHRSPVTDASG